VPPQFDARPAVDDVIAEPFADHRAALAWFATERAGRRDQIPRLSLGSDLTTYLRAAGAAVEAFQARA
jgi:hypothetical protein